VLVVLGSLNYFQVEIDNRFSYIKANLLLDMKQWGIANPLQFILDIKRCNRVSTPG